MNVCISIGNSDDKLSQGRWADYCSWVGDVIYRLAMTPAATIHGVFFSVPHSRYQNACWWVEIPQAEDAEKLRLALAGAAKAFDQDSIAWLSGEVEFVSGVEK